MSDVAILLITMCPGELGAPAGLRPLMFVELGRLPSGRLGTAPDVKSAVPGECDYLRRVSFPIHVGSASRSCSTYRAGGGTD